MPSLDQLDPQQRYLVEQAKRDMRAGRHSGLPYRLASIADAELQLEALRSGPLPDGDPPNLPPRWATAPHELNFPRRYRSDDPSREPAISATERLLDAPTDLSAASAPPGPTLGDSMPAVRPIAIDAPAHLATSVAAMLDAPLAEELRRRLDADEDYVRRQDLYDADTSAATDGASCTLPESSMPPLLAATLRALHLQAEQRFAAQDAPIEPLESGPLRLGSAIPFGVQPVDESSAAIYRGYLDTIKFQGGAPQPQLMREHGQGDNIETHDMIMLPRQYLDAPNGEHSYAAIFTWRAADGWNNVRWFFFTATDDAQASQRFCGEILPVELERDDTIASSEYVWSIAALPPLALFNIGLHGPEPLL